MLLTVEGVNVDASLVVSVIAAIGTVGTLVWAVFNGLELRRQADADRRQALIEKRLDQARRVCGWITSLGTESSKFSHLSHVRYAQRLYLSNSSAEPVYELVAYLVWVQGAAPRNGEAQENHYRGLGDTGGDVARVRAIVQVLPPGNYRLDLAGPPTQPMQGRLGLEVAFTDGAGRHWVRRAPTGDLEPLDTSPVKHYGISRPLTYNELETWPGSIR